MRYSFDTDIAARYGVEEAILLDHIRFWCEKNQSNPDCRKEGRCWMYASAARLAEHFFDRQLAARTKQGVHVRPVQMDMAVGDPNGGGALQPLLLLELLHHHAGDLADNLC